MVSALLAQAAHRRLSDTSRHCSTRFPHPQPLVINCRVGAVEQAHRPGGWEGQGGGDGGRRRGPQAGAQAMKLLVPCDAVVVQPGLRVGKGSLQRTRREAVRAPGEERLLLGAICIRPVKTGTVDTCQQCWGGRAGGSWDGRGHQTPREVTCRHPPPTLSHLPAWEFGGRDVDEFTLSVAQDTAAQDKRKTPGSPSNNRDLPGPAPHAR